MGAADWIDEIASGKIDEIEITEENAPDISSKLSYWSNYGYSSKDHIPADGIVKLYRKYNQAIEDGTISFPYQHGAVLAVINHRAHEMQSAELLREVLTKPGGIAAVANDAILVMHHRPETFLKQWLFAVKANGATQVDISKDIISNRELYPRWFMDEVRQLPQYNPFSEAGPRRIGEQLSQAMYDYSYAPIKNVFDRMNATANNDEDTDEEVKIKNMIFDKLYSLGTGASELYNTDEDFMKYISYIPLTEGGALSCSPDADRDGIFSRRDYWVYIDPSGQEHSIYFLESDEREDEDTPRAISAYHFFNAGQWGALDYNTDKENAVFFVDNNPKLLTLISNRQRERFLSTLCGTVAIDGDLNAIGGRVDALSKLVSEQNETLERSPALVVLTSRIMDMLSRIQEITDRNPNSLYPGEMSYADQADQVKEIATKLAKLWQQAISEENKQEMIDYLIEKGDSRSFYGSAIRWYY